MTFTNLKWLDQLLIDRMSLDSLKELICNLERYCDAVEKGANLGDLLNDPNLRNSSPLARQVSRYSGGFESSVGDPFEFLAQITLRMALSKFQSTHFQIKQDVHDPHRLSYLSRLFGQMKGYELVLCLQFPEATSSSSLLVINPARIQHWGLVEKIPAGSFVQIYMRGDHHQGSSSRGLAVLRQAESIFHKVQEPDFVPEKIREAPRMIRPSLPKSAPSRAPLSIKAANVLSDTLEVVINKMDTFIHAGNAHLIVSHLGSYPGRVELFVMRGDKVRVQLDPDSIWGAEIRNGEKVIFEFYGPKPSEGFLKDLSIKTNKYTQMDKVANE